MGEQDMLSIRSLVTLVAAMSVTTVAGAHHSFAPYFDTRIVFVDESGPKNARVKKLALMDQGGFNARTLTNGKEILLPGFVNGHHHVGLTPVQLGSPDMPLELWFITRLVTRVLDLHLDTLYSAFEMISSTLRSMIMGLKLT